MIRGACHNSIRTINPNRGKRSVKKQEKQRIVDSWIPPIICICNNNYDKKIRELKKDCLEVKFEKPSLFELCQVIKNVAQEEHMPLTESSERLIAELSQGDFRRLMFLLQNFSNIKKNPIELMTLMNITKSSSKKHWISIHSRLLIKSFRNRQESMMFFASMTPIKVSCL